MQWKQIQWLISVADDDAILILSDGYVSSKYTLKEIVIWNVYQITH